MTYENLLKWKKIYEERNDQRNLIKVLRNLKGYSQYTEGKPDTSKKKTGGS